MAAEGGSSGRRTVRSNDPFSGSLHLAASTHPSKPTPVGLCSLAHAAFVSRAAYLLVDADLLEGIGDH